MSAATDFDGRVETLRRALRARGYELEVIPNLPAAEVEITACERAIGRSLPEAYRALLRVHNGLSLTVNRNPAISPELILYGTHEIVDEHRRFEPLYRDVDRAGDWMGQDDTASPGPRFWDDLIAFAFYGDGLCVFDVSRDSTGGHVVRDLDLEDLQATRETIIATSFDDWVSKAFAAAVEERSFVYWLPGEP